jgi:hypothetical protein
VASGRAKVGRKPAYRGRLQPTRRAPRVVPCRFPSLPVDDWRGLITQRSRVQIPPPQPSLLTAGSSLPAFLFLDRQRGRDLNPARRAAAGRGSALNLSLARTTTWTVAATSWSPSGRSRRCGPISGSGSSPTGAEVWDQPSRGDGGRRRVAESRDRPGFAAKDGHEKRAWQSPLGVSEGTRGGIRTGSTFNCGVRRLEDVVAQDSDLRARVEEISDFSPHRQYRNTRVTPSLVPRTRPARRTLGCVVEAGHVRRRG